jgi:hypothetical protein
LTIESAKRQVLPILLVAFSVAGSPGKLAGGATGRPITTEKALKGRRKMERYHLRNSAFIIVTMNYESINGTCELAQPLPGLAL